VEVEVGREEAAVVVVVVVGLVVAAAERAFEMTQRRKLSVCFRRCPPVVSENVSHFFPPNFFVSHSHEHCYYGCILFLSR
jgi:hypothetical protein